MFLNYNKRVISKNILNLNTRELSLFWILLLFKSLIFSKKDFKDGDFVLNYGLIERRTLFNNVYKNLLFLNLLGIAPEIYHKFFIKMYLFAIQCKFLLTETKKFSGLKKKITTIIFVEILLKKKKTLNKLLLGINGIKYSLVGYTIIKDTNFAISLSFLSVYNIYKKNKSQKEVNSFPKPPLNNMINYKFILNHDMMDDYLMALKIDFKQLDIDLDLEDIKGGILIKTLNKELSIINNKLKSLKKDNELLNMGSNDSFGGERVEELKKKNQGFDINIKRKNKLTKLINLAIDYYMVFQLFNHKINYLYLPYFYDFRGRIYPNSLVGPTFNKLFRFIYLGLPLCDLKWKKFKIRIVDSLYYKNIIKYEGYLKSLFTEDSVINYLLLILLVDIGKIYKSSLTDKDYGVNMEDFIIKGLEVYKTSNPEFNNSEDFLTYKIAKKSINELRLEKKLITNYILNKDAPASVIQHWATILSPKDGIAPKLNLSGFRWCDYYMWTYSLFKEYLKDNNQWSDSFDSLEKKYIKRPFIKQTIMTVNYNATLYTTSNTFLNNFKIEDAEFSDFKYDEGVLRAFHKLLYDFLKKDHFKLIFKIDRDEVIVNIRNSGYTFFTDDECEVDLKLYECGEFVIKTYKIKSWRTELSSASLSNTLNLKKILNGIEPNLIQSKDAFLVRKILTLIPCFTIHDSFGAPITYQHILYDTINNHFHKINGTGYCLFILI